MLSGSIIDAAKSMFPNMPDEVFDIFLKPLIEVYGWSFVDVKESVPVESEWFRILYPCTLFAISQFVWNRRGFSILDTFHNVTIQDIELLIRIHKGTHPEIGENRLTISRHKETIMNTGSFSAPIIEPDNIYITRLF